MHIKHRNLLVAGILLSLGALAAVGAFYWAAQQAPAFYAEALSQDAVAVRQSSDVMVRRTAALVSDLRRRGQWQAIFTADQINGWLAYDVQKNHPHLFPPDVADPRVAIESDRLKVAFRWRKPTWSAVVSLEAELYLQDVNVIAVRIRQARAGKLPLPLGSLLEDVAASGREIGLAIDQKQVDGDPLLLITLPSIYGDAGKQLSLESLELHKGELYVAGQSLREGDGLPPLARNSARESASAPEAHIEKLNIQR